MLLSTFDKIFETSFKNEGCNVYQVKSDIIDKGLGNGFITLSSDIYINFIDTKYYDSCGNVFLFVCKLYDDNLRGILPCEYGHKAHFPYDKSI